MPQITTEFAKFDGRRKKFVLLNTLDESTATDEQKIEYARYQLLADLQTEWEKLRFKMPGNMTWLQSTAKYFRQALGLYNRQFIFIDKEYNFLNSNYQYWGSSLNAFQAQLTANVQPISRAGFENFRTFTIEHVKKLSKTEKEVTQAWATVAEFISYQNTNYMLAEHYYSELIPPKRSKLNPLTISQNWVTEGKKLNRIIDAVNAHWSRTAEYTNDEILGWLLYSGIVYGGINDSLLLAGWLQALIDDQAYPFIKERVYLSIRYQQTGYGNERIEDGKDIYNTKQVILDLVSQCWLVRYKAQNSNAATPNLLKPVTQKQIKAYVFTALSPVIEPLTIEVPTFSSLLMHASYHWEMLDNVSIDQASASILRGKHNHTGLMTTDFEKYLNVNYKNSISHSQYDLNDILKLKIVAPNIVENTLDDKKVSEISVRKSDLIQFLSKDFKNYKGKSKKEDEKSIDPYLTFVKKLRKRYEQYNALNEKIIIKWAISLINPKDKPSSVNILHYIKTIGYEWLYFTENQALQDWTEEDFEEMYDDIFEYKELERKVTELSYSAKLFQRMHRFAVNEFGLAPVVIEQARSNRRVRSELVSPQAYHAIIEQILESVDVLEREMFALLFILVYRTGMRKKELLGLRYIDIEGLSHNQPSIIVRPNKYRSTKTQGSIRRIAVFALLGPAELEFFTNFIESNIGNNPNKFIFTLSSAHQPVDDHVPLQLLKQILNDICVADADEPISFTFHAFRHTAVSNLSLVLNGRQELIEALTDYSTEDTRRIKEGLLGVHTEGSDRWYALSGIMGHLLPKRSLEYYNHIATLMATYELSFADIHLPLKTVNNITGITNKRLKENNALINEEQLGLISVRALLFKQIIEGARKSPRFAIEETKQQLLDYDLTTESPDLFRRYGINKLELFLNASDTLLSLKEAAHLAQISEDDAYILIKRAHQITTLMTKHSRPRFVRVGESGKSLFSPLRIQHQSDFRMLSILQHSAHRMREDNFADWQWFITICSQRLTVTTPSISFLENDKDDMLRFVTLAKKLLPAKNWLVTSNESLLSEYLEQEVFEGMRSYYREGTTTIHIGIVNRDTRDNQEKWKYSPLLRFFIHMMMVCDEQLTIE